MKKSSDEYIGVGDVQIPPLAKKYIKQILETKRLTFGEFTRKFEKEFAKIHNVKFAIFCNSGTSALQVAVHALKKKNKWKDGDEIIVPALTFVATVNVILQNNLKPVFVDIDPEDFNIDPKKIAKKITKKTRAIIPVHIGGQPADMDPILSLAKKYKLKIIEDSCETVFAKYKGKPVGSFGDISCFSTYAAHVITTGVGGFACTNDPELAVLLRSLFNHGRDSIYISIDDDNVTHKEKLLEIVGKRFSFVDVGYSFRATEFEAALGLAQLGNWSTMIKKRKKNAGYLTNSLKKLQNFFQLPKIRNGREHIFMFYPIVIKDKRIEREKLVMFLEERKIETRYLLPLLTQPVYINMFGDISDDYPNAKDVSQNGFYVGSHPGLKKKDMDKIADAINLFLKEEGIN